MPLPCPPSVHYHPDGDICVRDGDKVYIDHPDHFESDFGVTFPPLPEGAVEEIYDQGRRYCFHNAMSSLVGGGEMPWPFGDDVLTKLDAALALKAERDKLTAEATQRQFMEPIKAQAAESQARAGAELIEKIRKIVHEELAAVLR